MRKHRTIKQPTNACTKTLSSFFENTTDFLWRYLLFSTELSLKSSSTSMHVNIVALTRVTLVVY